MSVVERGLSNVSLDTIERIAAALGTLAGDLLLEAERPAAKPDDAPSLHKADSDVQALDASHGELDETDSQSGIVPGNQTD